MTPEPERDGQVPADANPFEAADEILTRVTFSDSEIASLRGAIRAHRSLSCPRCGRPLNWGPPPGVHRLLGLTWVVHCGECVLGLTVGDFRGLRVTR